VERLDNGGMRKGGWPQGLELALGNVNIDAYQVTLPVVVRVILFGRFQPMSQADRNGKFFLKALLLKNFSLTVQVPFVVVVS